MLRLFVQRKPTWRTPITRVQRGGCEYESPVGPSNPGSLRRRQQQYSTSTCALSGVRRGRADQAKPGAQPAPHGKPQPALRSSTASSVAEAMPAGTSGSAPLKLLDEQGLATSGKRFRFVPLNKRLQQTSARPAALPTIDFDANLHHVAPHDTSFSHFHTTLAAEADSNITASFREYHYQVRKLSLSLPLLYRNRSKLFEETIHALEKSTTGPTANPAHATPSIARCLTALCKDLGPQSFYPFFACLVQAFAAIFAKDRADVSGAALPVETKKRPRHSILWDTQSSIVPLFATLADITKICLHQMAINPRDTINALLPLLSSPIRRVREMTAEACLGYLIRKTRQPQCQQQLVHYLVSASADYGTPDAAHQFTVDGLGVSLFESLRLPRGRAQPSAPDIVRYAMQSLDPSTPSQEREFDRNASDFLSVVARCFSSIARHLKQHDDVFALLSALTLEGDAAIKAKSNRRAANVAFLLRNWWRCAGSSLNDAIGREGMDKVSSFLSRCMQKLSDDKRVVYESFGSILLMSLSDKGDSSISQVPTIPSIHRITEAISVAMQHCDQNGLLAMLHALLLMPGVHFNQTAAAGVLEPTFALCDRLADLCSTENSQVPLIACGLLFRRFESAGCDLSMFCSLRAPAIDAIVKQTLSKAVGATEISQGQDVFVDGQSDASHAIEYLCYVRISDVEEVFHQLLNGVSTWDSPSFPKILKAVSRNFADEEVSPSSDGSDRKLQRLPERVASLVQDAVSSRSLTSASLLDALSIFFEAFPSLSRSCLLQLKGGLETLHSPLHKNLASPQTNIRVNSARLLALSSSICLSDADHQHQETDTQEADFYMERLQSAFDVSGKGLHGLHDCFVLLLSAPTSLRDISRNERVLQELVRSVRFKKLNNEMTARISHFCIGLLRTPIRALWDGAGQLWCALASIDREQAMKLAFEYLLDCENGLLTLSPPLPQAGNGHAAPLDEATVPMASGNENADGAESLEEKADSDEDKRGRVSANRNNLTNAALGKESQWKTSEWEEQNMEPSIHLHVFAAASDEDRTNIVSSYVELVKVLAKEPRHTIPYRSKLIHAYLRLQETGRKAICRVVTSFTTLLEKMGGLKCCESDVNLEQLLRERLLVHLTKMHPTLQIASIRCLCSSRSPALKPHRDSLIRLIDEKIFREELTVLTESLFRKSSIPEVGTDFTESKKQVAEVITRILFSKMSGRQKKIDSKRAAVLSFLVSRIPIDLAIPILTSLALAPIEREIEKCGQESSFRLDVDLNEADLPVPSVQRGVVSIVGAIVKQCKRSIPAQSWKRLGVGMFLLLRHSFKEPNGQEVRSGALNILAEMYRARANDIPFLVVPVLDTIRSSAFDISEQAGGSGVPALMRFVEAVMSSDSAEGREKISEEHRWSLKYCVQAMRRANAGPNTVELSIRVAKEYSANFCDTSTGSTTRIAISQNDSHTPESLLAFICDSLRELLYWVIELMSMNKAMQRTWTSLFQQALVLTSNLARIRSLDYDCVRPLADGLSSFLEVGNASADSQLQALQAVSAILTKGVSETSDMGDHMSILNEVEAIRGRLFPLLNRKEITNHPESIFTLCEMISKSPSSDLAAAGLFLIDLNAFDSSRLETPDYDKRIGSLKQVNKCIKSTLGGEGTTSEEGIVDILLVTGDSENEIPAQNHCGPKAISALLYGFLAAIRVDDTAVRGTAGYSLLLLAEWAGRCKSENAAVSRRTIFSTLRSTVAASKTMVGRRECCRTLGMLLRSGSWYCDSLRLEFTTSPEEEERVLWLAMSGLARENDLESDFFENIVHLQPHRRGRALRQLQKHMLDLGQRKPHSSDVDEKMGLTLADEFALPLGLNMAMEKTWTADDSGKPRPGKHAESREGAQKGVTTWAIDLVGACSKLLPWSVYKSLFASLLRQLKRKEDEEDIRNLEKVLVSTCQGFPRLEDPRTPNPQEASDFLTGMVIPEMLSHINPSAVAGKVLREDASSVQGASTHMRNQKDRPVFQAPIAKAVAELMTCLPPSSRDSHLSLLIAPLSGALRSRLSGPRDEAKKALTAVVLILGEKYLKYVLHEVLHALREGFRKDGCVYVIHAVLKGIDEYCRNSLESNGEWKVFAVDSACEILVRFLSQELEDGLGESKADFADPNTSSARERQASLRASRVYLCLELLAEHVKFDDSAHLLCRPFLMLQKRAKSSKFLNKTRLALRHLVHGFSRSRSMQAEDALKLCYTYANLNCLPASQEKENGEAREDAVMTEKMIGLECDGIETVNFGLQLLKAVITRNDGAIRASDERGVFLQSMCEPLLPIVVRAMDAGNDDLTLNAFRTCQKLLKLPLSNRASMADKLTGTIVDVLSSGSGGIGSHSESSVSEDLFNTCLRAGAILLSEVGPKGFTVVSRDRVEALVAISCNCIEHGSVDSRSAAISVLRAIVSGRIILPSVYDAIQRVNEMAIHSHSGSLRKACINLSVSFLVSFPLGSKRVRQHLEFFVRNLNYSAANGRLAALQALEIVINKFPAEALEDENEYLFVALTAAGARDSDKECRARASEGLKGLFRKWRSGRQNSEMVRMGAMLAGVSCDMNCEEDEIVVNVGEDADDKDAVVERAGMVGLTAAALSEQLSETQLTMIARVAVAVLKRSEDTCGWETKYGILHCIEACIGSQATASTKIEVDEKLDWLWKQMGGLLLDNHQWVRLSACRLLGCHLSAVGGRDADATKLRNEGKTMWRDNELVREILKALCMELEATHVSIELGQQALKNIVCMGDVLKQHASAGDIGEEQEDEEDKEDMDCARDDGMGRMLRWLVTRMAGMASRGGKEGSDLLRRACGLRFLVVTTKWWGKWITARGGRLYVKAVVRVLESGDMVHAAGAASEDENTQAVNTDTLVALARGLQTQLMEHMGTEEFYAEYRRVAGARQAVKQQRKRNEALAAAIDPQRMAKKRRAKAMARQGKRARQRYGRGGTRGRGWARGSGGARGSGEVGGSGDQMAAGRRERLMDDM